MYGEERESRSSDFMASIWKPFPVCSGAKRGATVLLNIEVNFMTV
jgi:hypothetical protein